MCYLILVQIQRRNPRWQETNIANVSLYRNKNYGSNAGGIYSMTSGGGPTNTAKEHSERTTLKVWNLWSKGAPYD